MSQPSKNINITLGFLIVHLVMVVGSFLFEDDIFSICGSAFFFAWILLCVCAMYRSRKLAEENGDDPDELSVSSPLILMMINACGSVCMLFDAFYVARVLACIFGSVMSIALVSLLNDNVKYNRQMEELTRVELESIKKEYESIKNKRE